ncbi:MAG: aldo/keto reductase, partial [Plesiomonas shigelloides]
MERVTLAADGPQFSRMVMGYWRLLEWNMAPMQLADFIQQHIDLGITTTDHADIYGGYQCEAAFGAALKQAPHLRQQIEIVSKCGIALTARPEHQLNHYNTEARHIIQSAEQS